MLFFSILTDLHCMYIDSIIPFKERLEAGTLPPKTTLNLSEQDIEDDVGALLQQHPYPPELSLDFGQQQLSIAFVTSLMNGLTSAHAAPGTILHFQGHMSLQYKSIQRLTDALVSRKLQPALTLYLSAENFGTYRVFALLVDAITSPDCVPWLTVDFSGSIINQASFDYLIHALETRTYSTRLWVNLDTTEPNTRHLALQKSCERATPARYAHVDICQDLPHNHYITNLRDFEKKLHFNLLPTDTMLDLSNHNIRQDLGLLLREHPYPRELSIEFGQQKLSDTFVTSLMDGLMSAHGTPGITLGFWGHQNLSRVGIHLLINGLLSQRLQPALTLYISATPLEQHRAFYVFVDAITSKHCTSWLTIDFHDSKINFKNMKYLVKKLKEKNSPIGLLVLTGKNGTDEQRHAIAHMCEQSNKAGLAHLKTARYTEATQALLMQRANETLRCIIPENRNAVSTLILKHMATLNQITKKKRLEALKLLLSMLVDPKQQTKTIYDVLCTWERTHTQDGTTLADSISSIRAFFSTFRSNKQTSTQELIAQLKRDYADPPGSSSTLNSDNTQAYMAPAPTNSNTKLAQG